MVGLAPARAQHAPLQHHEHQHRDGGGQRTTQPIGGQGQALHGIAIQTVQVLGQVATLRQIQASPEAFFQNAHGLADGLALGFDLSAFHGATGHVERLQETVEQHAHQLVRVGGAHAGVGGYAFVGRGGS